MTDQPQLFPEPQSVEPPERCPHCGGHMRRRNFTLATCDGFHADDGCGYEWRRSGQLATNEPWPGEPF